MWRYVLFVQRQVYNILCTIKVEKKPGRVVIHHQKEKKSGASALEVPDFLQIVISKISTFRRGLCLLKHFVLL